MFCKKNYTLEERQTRLADLLAISNFCGCYKQQKISHIDKKLKFTVRKEEEGKELELESLKN